MLRKLVALALLGLMLLNTAACGSTTETSSKNDDTPLALGEQVTIEGICEFEIEYMKMTKDVMPPKVASYYTHYEADSGNVYLDVCVKYKNLENSPVRADSVLAGMLYYDHSYEYEGFSIIEEEGRTDFTYSNITDMAPLTTEYLHYLFQLPQDVQDSDKAIDLTLLIADQTYSINARAEGTSGAVDLSTVKVQKIKEKEHMTSADVSASITKTQIKKKIKPSKTSGVYSYYEADAGKVYVDIQLLVENKAGSSINAENLLSAKLIYDNQYEYMGWIAVEKDNGTSITNGSIYDVSAGQKAKLHYLFELPDQIKNETKSCKVVFYVGDAQFEYKVR